MGIKLDITEKLNFQDKPKLVIKDTELTINNSAPAVLSIMELYDKTGENFDYSFINQAIKILFTKESQKKLDDLGLSFDDFSTVLTEAVELVASNGEEKKGE